MGRGAPRFFEWVVVRSHARVVKTFVLLFLPPGEFLKFGPISAKRVYDRLQTEKHILSGV